MVEMRRIIHQRAAMAIRAVKNRMMDRAMTADCLDKVGYGFGRV